jgi:hypothetical protein
VSVHLVVELAADLAGLDSQQSPMTAGELGGGQPISVSPYRAISSGTHSIDTLEPYCAAAAAIVSGVSSPRAPNSPNFANISSSPDGVMISRIRAGRPYVELDRGYPNESLADYAERSASPLMPGFKLQRIRCRHAAGMWCRSRAH